MQIINTEILVSSLFYLGFDKVDSVLFTFTLARSKAGVCVYNDNRIKELSSPALQ